MIKRVKFEITFEIEDENDRPIAYLIIAKVIEFISKKEEVTNTLSREVK